MHRPTTRILLASFCILLCSGRLPALQGSKADYERAAGLGRLHAGKMLRADVRPTWLDATRLWYQVRTGPVTSEFVLVDLAAPKDERRQVLATDAELAQILGVGRDQGRVARLAVDAEGSLQLLLWGEAGAFAWNRATGTAAPLDPAEVGAFQLESRARIRPSRQRGRPTGILFVNTTEGPAQLFWLDTGGERRDYGEIAAGGRKWQGTTDGHAFFAEAPDGTVLGRFVAETEPGVAVLSWQAATREPAQPREGSQPREGRDGPRRTPENDEAAFEPFVRDHDLWLRDRQSGTEQRLTTDGSEGNAYGGPFLWSPDGGRLACLQTEPAQEHTVHFVESAPRDQLQPKLHSFDYLKPGDVVAHQRVRMFAVGSGGAARALPVGDELAPEPYNLSRFAWDPDGSHFTYLYNQRGHQIQRWIAVDAESGASTVRIEERSETFVDYAQKTWAYRLEATDELIWASERSGWNHLYLLDAGTGAVKRALTSGEFVVRGIEQVDEARRRALIRISGYHSDQDPYHVHWALVGLDDAAMTVLTQGDGTHEVAWAPDGEHYVDTWSRVDQPPVTELRRAADGGLVAELERADDSLLRATGSEPPQRFVAKGRDGTTDIWGVVYRPTNHDPARKYPLIESIYAGPHGAFVPKDFRAHRAQQELAELGFVVVQIDGMGTNWRSKAFQDVAWKNIGDSGFPDRRLWIEALAATDASIDLTHVGIYGGSAGGQSALRALLAHGDFYHAAVSDCGCHDNRMDKIWWNELWMGWPVGPHYAEQSNVTQAQRLQGDLLLIVGEMDRNVDPASTMQVVKALIDADKDFELLVMPGMGHGAGGGPYGTRRTRDFFVRKLLGRAPRWD